MAVPAAVFGRGDIASKQLEKANLLTTGIGLPLPAVAVDFNAMRLGTQEITRWGMRPEIMETIADLRKLIDLLAKRGYSESDVEGMMHGNWIRRLNDIWSE